MWSAMNLGAVVGRKRSLQKIPLPSPWGSVNVPFFGKEVYMGVMKSRILK